MPYIEHSQRELVDDDLNAIIDVLDEEGWPTGMVNYIISSIVWTWFKQRPSYSTINAIKGALGCVWDEFYRRLAAPYEDTKRGINGDLKIHSPFMYDNK